MTDAASRRDADKMPLVDGGVAVTTPAPLSRWEVGADLRITGTTTRAVFIKPPMIFNPVAPVSVAVSIDGGAGQPVTSKPGPFRYANWDTVVKLPTLGSHTITVHATYGLGHVRQASVILEGRRPRVTVHIKVVTEPTTVGRQQMQDQMRTLYASVGIDVDFATVETLSVPATLQTVDVGSCTGGSETAEQTQLFSNRNNAGNDICVYFVTATNPPYNGCAAYAGLPSAVVASTASGWTLAHEVGHILGLPHIDAGAAAFDFDKLMTGGGTWNITNPPPDITPGEVATMNASTLTT